MTERRSDTLGARPDDQGHRRDQTETQSPGRQHCVEQPPVEKADNGALDHQTDEADYNRRQRHPDPQVKAMGRAQHHGVGAEHDELALGEVDDPHHAVDDRQPQREQHKAGDGEDNSDEGDDQVFHGWVKARRVGYGSSASRENISSL